MIGRWDLREMANGIRDSGSSDFLCLFIYHLKITRENFSNKNKKVFFLENLNEFLTSIDDNKNEYREKTLTKKRFFCEERTLENR